MTVDELVAEVLLLPLELRMEVVDSLLSSLREPDPEIEQAWADEAERRMAAVEAGEAELIAAEEVYARIRLRLGR